MGKVVIVIAVVAVIVGAGIFLVPQLFPSQSGAEPVNGSNTTTENGSNTTLEIEELLYDRTWISPGKVQIGNFYPGGRVECISGSVGVLRVHNGNNYTVAFNITYRYPDSVGEGYVKPIEEVEDWVIIADPTPILAPYETKVIPMTLAMPGDAVVFAPKWEFWVSVKDMTQTGMVQTELCSRWLVDMR